MSKDITQERLDEIAAEVFTLSLEAQRNDDYWPVDQLLQNVMQRRSELEALELAMYLRSTYHCNQHLPTWHPLMNAAVEQGRMRGDPVNDIFYGLTVARRDTIVRNTGNLPS
jgi:hypothetical protein